MPEDEKTPLETLADLLIYAPLGAAAVARDMLPPLRDRLVSRGRDELGHAQIALRNQLGVASTLGRAALKQVMRLRSQLPAGSGDNERPTPTGPRPVPGDGASAIREAQSRVGRTFQDVESRRPPEAGQAGEGDQPAAPAPGAVARHRAEVDEARTQADRLAISDYESLSAAQVNARLGALSPVELAAVREYEQSHRARRTILARIDALIAP